MRLKISLAASLALAALVVAACGPQDSSAPATGGGRAASNQTAANSNGAQAGPSAAPTAAQADGVRRITIEEARAEIEAGRAVAFDVRNQQSYEAGHIKGARVVPYDQVEQHLADFPKDKLIITYCA